MLSKKLIEKAVETYGIENLRVSRWIQSRSYQYLERLDGNGNWANLGKVSHRIFDWYYMEEMNSIFFNNAIYRLVRPALRDIKSKTVTH